MRIGTSSSSDSATARLVASPSAIARVADRVVARVAEPALQESVGQELDHVVVFGVDHDQRALAPRQRQDFEHLAVVEPHRVVGHVDLERGVAVLDQRRQLLSEHLLVGVGDDQVKGVVDDRLGQRRRAVLLDHLAQRLAAMLRGERDHRRRAAERRGDGGAVEIVGADDAKAGALLDMAMAVDGPGHDELAARVDLARRRAEAAAERDDGPVLDADVAMLGVGGRHHRAVFDDEVVIGHGCVSRMAAARRL